MKTVLLVEDDPFLVDIYTTKLSEWGFDVEVSIDGKDCLEIIRKMNAPGKKLWPDLMILDIVLPEVDGWEILREIRNDKQLKDLKIFVLSNLGEKHEVDKGLSLGATKYFIKAHYTPLEVIEKIIKELEQNG